MAETNSLIACDLQDYFEIACMYHYELHVSMGDGRHYCGMARDIATKDKQEYLVLFVPGIGHERIALNEVARLEVLTPNAKFQSVDLRSGKVA